MQETRIPYDVKVFDKAESPFAKRLRELVTNPSALKDSLGCSLQAINQYKQGTAFPKTENLIKIADFYGVSVDYLLGRTDVRSMDGNSQAAHTLTGLSEKALNLLNEWKNSDDRRRDWPEYLSWIIEDNESDRLFGNLSEIMGSAMLTAKTFAKLGANQIYKQQLNDNLVASLWYLSRNLSNIVERLFLTHLDRCLQNESTKKGEE